MQAMKEKSEIDPQESSHVEPRPQRIGEKKVKDLIVDKRRLVEVPYTASLADTMNALMANRVVAVPVAAPPGHWIGAGGSMILESDKQTGAVRKHYIGMVTMLDILAHISGNDVFEAGKNVVDDLDKKMSVPVSSIIGHCLESLSLWTLNPNTSILDCMEVFSKGIHRALVPVDSHLENVAGVELVESASSYRMLTQMDLLKFLKAHHEGQLRGLLTRSLRQAGALTDVIFGVTDKARVIDVIKCMRTASLTAVPIVQSSSSIQEDHAQLVNGKQRKLVGTFSATDLRGCPVSQLQGCLKLGVVEFLEKLAETPLHQAACLRSSVRDPVACREESLLGEAVDKAITYGVHRVWVVDGQGLLDGLISLTDMIRVMRAWLLNEQL
ncbi:OLC1v1037436C2 [Oldenlandia corymbosa var. corymbosa]|nr:OLC1v1037436C2 [Oldenlandia corymbosa var. corymbosa]